MHNRAQKKMPVPVKGTSPPRVSFVRKVQKKELKKTAPIMASSSKACPEAPPKQVEMAKAPQALAPTEAKAPAPSADPWTLRRVVCPMNCIHPGAKNDRTVDGRELRVNPPPAPVEVRRG